MAVVDRAGRIARAALAAVCLAFMVLACSEPPLHQSAPLDGTEVVISTSSLGINTPSFYTYHHEGKNINFFVLHDGSRTVSYFDACRTCYKSRLGYAYSDGHVICRACNMSFSLDALDRGIGGCYPVKLKGTESGGIYRIPLSSLINNADLF